MNRVLLVGMMALFLLALPLTAYAGRDYIEGVLEEWTEYAEDEGYELIDWDIDELDDETAITYTLELDRGEYWVVAEGGRNVEDLDLRAYYWDDYDEGDDPFVEDELADNYPMLEFELRQPDTVVIEVFAYEFDPGEDEGYYCILFAEQN
jgi:hypothetical protein